MGEYAEDAFMRDLDDGFWFGRRSRGRSTYRPTVCKYCGSTSVKWRLDTDGWRLYDTVREHPGNHMPRHNCRAETALEFDDCSE